MRGHGTYMKNGTLYASVAGVIQRVNKLISVTPLKTKYQGEIGDVIVGKYNLFITCQKPILNSKFTTYFVPPLWFMVKKLYAIEAQQTQKCQCN